MEQATIIVVDDVAVVRNVLAKWLSSCSCVVYEADDGYSGLEAIKLHPPHLIILDVMMRRMNGLEMLKALKNDADFDKFKDIDVIMCTAKGERSNVYEAVRLGACDYIVKPFKMHTVIEKVFKALERKFGSRFANLRDTFSPSAKPDIQKESEPVPETNASSEKPMEEPDPQQISEPPSRTEQNGP